MSTYICKVCNKEMTKKGFGGHISYKHKLTAKEYYDKYLKQPEEGICPICGKETQFQRIFAGYAKYCCTSCARQDFNVQNKYTSTMKEKYGYEHALQVPEIHSKLLNTLKEKQSKFELENNCVRIKSLFPIYGFGWYQANIVDLIVYNGNTYVSKNDIDKIIDYTNKNHTKVSIEEKELVDTIKSVYFGPIETNTRKVISPKELDIYLPDLKLAIEYNGLYWHSNKRQKPEYHLNKSLVCREKNIRLIHIYEFEDLKQQKQLLKDLILGKDNYPKEDFNKNNLIKNIPKPTIIYNEHYTIYGAGSLY